MTTMLTFSTQPTRSNDDDYMLSKCVCKHKQAVSFSEIELLVFLYYYYYNHKPNTEKRKRKTAKENICKYEQINQ